ncbi:hypothetical protein HW555_001164 [Spodoptera exigua]|uniref:GCS light chain n=1 Tax=Spodoptera exigua TaxID=7107 RepID=A0A835GT54_SPOEX|nr:hypothetical protein HW555_001164 [Spodoptera exigua]
MSYLSESIKLTLSEWGTQNGVPVQNGVGPPPGGHPQTSHRHSDYKVMTASAAAGSEAVINITRPHDDVQIKMAEEERKNLKIGVKIFINEDSTTALTECLENVFSALHTEYIDNVILAYNPDLLHREEANDDNTLKNTYATKASPISLGSNVRMSSTEVEADNEADARKCEAILPGIKILWAVLEDFVKEGRVQQLGVADVGDLLSIAAVKTLSDAGVGCDNLDWCARYQVHIKCRGVLALKGYVCKATLDTNSDKLDKLENI